MMNPPNDNPFTHKPHPKRVLHWLLLLMVIWGAILGCTLVGGPDESDLDGIIAAQTGTAQALQQSLENLGRLATQTAQARPTITPIRPSPFPTYTSVVPTHTPVASAVMPATQPPGLVNKIRFPSGGTSAYFERSITAGEQHLYNLRALKDQTLILAAASPGNDVFLDVIGLDGGEHLLWSSTQATSWFGTLPQNQVYQIRLTTDNAETYYFFQVEVPATIRFETGAYSASVDGYITVDGDFHPQVMTRVRYQAFAFADQTMTVKLTSPHLEDLSLGIVGQQDGQVYLRYEVKNAGVELILPATQAYYLDVYAINGVSAAFTLEVTIK